jgi:hypothetical protein
MANRRIFKGRLAVRLLGEALLALLLLACGGKARAPETAAPETETVVLRVRNENPANVRIYAVRSTTQYRLGVVTTFRTESFEIPALVYRSTGRVQFMVVPVGGGQNYVTEPILIAGTHRIDLRVSNPLVHSQVLVR